MLVSIALGLNENILRNTALTAIGFDRHNQQGLFRPKPNASLVLLVSIALGVYTFINTKKKITASLLKVVVFYGKIKKSIGELLMTKGELAKQIFTSGRNCAQAVALAFKDELDLSEEQICKLIIGFGGGFARQRLVCGAVSGMVMVLGYLKSDGDDRIGIYTVVQKACAEVKEELGSIICSELLEGVQTTSGGVPDKRTEEYYKKRPCADICEVIANITDKYLKS